MIDSPAGTTLRNFRAMGSEMSIAFEGEAAPISRAVRRFRAWERALSRFNPDSELSRLNASAGRPFPCSRILWDVLRAALWGAVWSDGLVVPTVLPALEQAGYDRSFEQLPANAAGPAGAGPSPDWRAIAVTPARREVTLPVGCRLDFGGVAKGWAADRAAALLGRQGAALVDASGDIAISGPRLDGEPWTVAVSALDETVPPLTTLLLRAGGVASSGQDVHRWRRGGRWQHHIIDPRTGRPAETDVLRATVIAPSATIAEIAAKTVFLRGAADGIGWIEGHPALSALVIREDGSLLASSRFPVA